MFKINRKIEYALIALKHIVVTDQNRLVSAKEICDAYGVPFDPTSRVLQIMAQHGILQVEHGSKGGYSLKKNLNSVSLKDLTEMVVGPISVVNCLHDENGCCDIINCCQIISPMLNLSNYIKKMFNEINVGELISSKNPNENQVREQVTKLMLQKN